MKRSAALLATAATLLATTAAAQSVDPNLPEYEPVSGVSGNLTSIARYTTHADLAG